MTAKPKILSAYTSSGQFYKLTGSERDDVAQYLTSQCEEKKRPLPVLDALTGIVSDWLGIARLAAEYERGGWIFRGQTHPFALQPKIFRKGTRRGPRGRPGPPHKLSEERRIFDQFVRGSRPYLEHSPSGKMEWLAIAQHHGLPTRLLDWSESFLAAIYFAVRSAGVDGFPTIYAFKHKSLPSVSNTKADPFKLSRVSLYWPPHIASRIPAQQALFTVHPSPSAKFQPSDLQQWLIEPSACFKLKKQLRVCGMTESVLFPSIDGLAGHLSWVYKWPGAME